MHSLETGIIVSIAAFFFFSFLSFTFIRENEISSELANKAKEEKIEYTVGESKKFNPELIKNIVSIIVEGGQNDTRNEE